MYTPEVVFLNITTWVGTCAIGAEHWYGRLHWYNPEFEEGEYGGRKRHEQDVEYVMTREDARRLNGQEEYGVEGKFFGHHTYNEGDTTTRFFSREALIKAALDCWQDVVPHGKVLLDCDIGCCSPCEIFAGPPKLKRLGNVVNQRDNRWERSDVLEKQWEKLFKKHGFLEEFED